MSDRVIGGSGRSGRAGASALGQILRLEVPIVVRLGERTMNLGEVMAMTPGAILEFQKKAEEELDLLVNDRVIGCGTAVKVGENFGLKVTHIGDVRERAAALAAEAARTQQEEMAAASDDDPVF